MGLNTVWVKDAFTGEWEERLKTEHLVKKNAGGSRELMKFLRKFGFLPKSYPGGLFHCKCTPVRRSAPKRIGGNRKANSASTARNKQKSAVATAAYNSRSDLFDEEQDRMFTYGRHKDKPLAVWIIAPKDAPEWVQDRQRLWNEVQKRERGAKFQLSRSWEMAFPKMFSLEQMKEAVEEFCKEDTEDGYVDDCAIHSKEYKYAKNPLAGQVKRDANGDIMYTKKGTPKIEPAKIKVLSHANPHVHIQSTIRAFDPTRPDGWAKRKWRWDDHKERDHLEHRCDELKRKRQRWADVCNAILERDFPEEYEEYKLDPRSYKERGIDKEPGRHIGPARANMAARDSLIDGLAQDVQIVYDTEIEPVTDKELAAAVSSNDKIKFADETEKWSKKILADFENDLKEELRSEAEAREYAKYAKKFSSLSDKEFKEYRDNHYEDELTRFLCVGVVRIIQSHYDELIDIIYSETDFEERREIVGIMSDRANGLVPSYPQNNIFKPFTELEYKTEDSVFDNDKSIAAAKKLFRLTQKNPNLKFSRKLGVSLFHWSENSGEATKYRALRKAFENEHMKREKRSAEKTKDHSVSIKDREERYEIGM